MSPTSSSNPKVAVVILNWNGIHFLQQFLPSVTASIYKNLDIYVADNASTDDSVPFIQQSFPSIKIIQNAENYGFAGGYNEALKKVEADYYVLLNSDVEVTPNWIQPIIDLMESNKTIAACQPKVKAFHNKKQFEYAGAAGGLMDRFGYTFCRG
ncbi:MAG: glycosyltransferase family 2 protein, partial [Chitinophagales bacterium]